MIKILLAAVYLVITSSTLAQRSKSVFLEVGGNGGLGSVNFDSRLNKTEKGLGYRVGLGFIPRTYSYTLSRPAIWTIPAGLNYLIGGQRHYLETGVGLTYYYFSGSTSDVWGIQESDKGGGIVFIPSAGYRYAPNNKAFQGRLFVSPLISSSRVRFYWGFSGGYKF